jgi:DNA-directed RNA polymerase subunit RPC12/RpoP
MGAGGRFVLKCPKCSRELSQILADSEADRENLREVGCPHCGASFDFQAALKDAANRMVKPTLDRMKKAFEDINRRSRRR